MSCTMRFVDMMEFDGELMQSVRGGLTLSKCTPGRFVSKATFKRECDSKTRLRNVRAKHLIAPITLGSGTFTYPVVVFVTAANIVRSMIYFYGCDLNDVYFYASASVVYKLLTDMGDSLDLIYKDVVGSHEDLFDAEMKVLAFISFDIKPFITHGIGSKTKKTLKYLRGEYNVN